MQIEQINNLKNKIISGYEILLDEAICLVNTEHTAELCQASFEIMKHFCGLDFDMCSIINAKSGKCSENCKWCAQSAHHNTGIETYDIVDKKLAIESALSNSKQGVRRFSLVTSGKYVTDAELDKYIEIYRKIRNHSDISLCASMGLLTKSQLQRLKDAEIEHYHCNLETAPSYFKQICTTHTIEDKLQTIQWAKETGLKICSGGIIGMGETMGQRIELAFALKKIDVKSIPINILNPIEGTALQGTAPLTDDEILKTIAVFRFINPDCYLRFAGGRLLIRHLQETALKSGMNASIVGDLLTTIGSNVEEDKRDFTNAGFSL